MIASRRKNAIFEARELLEQRPLYLDTETTGLGAKDVVMEIGIIDDEGNVLVDSLIRQSKTIDPSAGRMHGITSVMLAQAPTWESAWPQAEAVLQNRKVGVYNVEFDLRLMKQTHSRTWLRWVLPETNFFDIMKLYASFYGDWDPARRSYRYQTLEYAGRQCGISLPNAHRAVDDCLLTRALLHHIAESD